MNENVPFIFAVVQFLMTLGALVWGAATINSRVKSHTSVMEALTQELHGIHSFLHQIDKRVAILEDRRDRYYLPNDVEKL